MRAARVHQPMLAVVIAAALALTACAPALSIGVNAAPDLRPAAYRTFTWDLPDQFPTGDPRLDNNPFFVRELQNAVVLQLQGLGLREASGAADLTVHFHATVRNRVEVYDADTRAGYVQPGSHAQMHEYEEGTILVDIAERATKKMIWRGWVQTDVTSAIADNDALGERVRRGMKELFAKFPATVVARAP